MISKQPSLLQRHQRIGNTFWPLRSQPAIKRLWAALCSHDLRGWCPQNALCQITEPSQVLHGLGKLPPEDESLGLLFEHLFAIVRVTPRMESNHEAHSLESGDLGLFQPCLAVLV